ncbi:MAG: nitroreductase family protein [Desulfovibrio sp.]|nr:nitroreductase family protein [Desulfovibrio sp.]
MDFLELVKKARSCRRFAEDKPLSKDDLDWLVENARFTPSARNGQVVRVVEVLSETAALIFPHTHWAMALKDWKGPYPGERPTAFLAMLLPEKSGETAFIDLGIFCQTIQLAAHTKGFGCCMIKSFDQAQVEKILKVKAPYQAVLLLGLGVAVEKRMAVDLLPDGSLNYYRDADGLHYVPKRLSKDLILNCLP